ncbi:MAG: hypothetical protein K2P63_00285 [Lachnospiraceae bacterium]|nr:hypothetical protein [Lachnospiraceae bacterium]
MHYIYNLMADLVGFVRPNGYDPGEYYSAVERYTNDALRAAGKVDSPQRVSRSREGQKRRQRNASMIRRAAAQDGCITARRSRCSE